MDISNAFTTLHCQESASLDEVTKQYRKLLIQSHPDHGGNTIWFTSVRTAYNTILSQHQYTKSKKNDDGTWEKHAAHLTETVKNKIADIIETVTILEVSISVMGSWIWITGNTKPIKNTLKGLDLKFSRNKSAWYWHEGEYRRRSKKTYSLSDIATMHGRVDLEAKNKDKSQKFITA